MTITRWNESVRLISPVLDEFFNVIRSKPGRLPKRLVVEDKQPATSVPVRLRERIGAQVVGHPPIALDGAFRRIGQVHRRLTAFDSLHFDNSFPAMAPNSLVQLQR